MILPYMLSVMALLQSSSCCHLTDSVMCVFLAVPWVGLWSISTEFPGHTCYNFYIIDIYNKM